MNNRPILRQKSKAQKRAEAVNQPSQPAWWSMCAQPDQREAFMVAAKQREVERATKLGTVYLKPMPF